MLKSKHFRLDLPLLEVVDFIQIISVGLLFSEENYNENYSVVLILAVLLRKQHLYLFVSLYFFNFFWLEKKLKEIQKCFFCRLKVAIYSITIMKI